MTVKLIPMSRVSKSCVCKHNTPIIGQLGLPNDISRQVNRMTDKCKTGYLNCTTFLSQIHFVPYVLLVDRLFLNQVSHCTSHWLQPVIHLSTCYFLTNHKICCKPQLPHDFQAFLKYSFKRRTGKNTNFADPNGHTDSLPIFASCRDSPLYTFGFLRDCL